MFLSVSSTRISVPWWQRSFLFVFPLFPTPSTMWHTPGTQWATCGLIRAIVDVPSRRHTRWAGLVCKPYLNFCGAWAGGRSQRSFRSGRGFRPPYPRLPPVMVMWPDKKQPPPTGNSLTKSGCMVNHSQHWQWPGQYEPSGKDSNRTNYHPLDCINNII